MTKSSPRVTLAFACTLAACAPVAPAVQPPRPVMAISSSFGKTWDSAVELLAERSVQIKTIDRTSGLIIAEPGGVVAESGLADCGKNWMGETMYPTHRTWNVLVRGDSAQSTVRATIRYIRVGKSRDVTERQISEDCESLGSSEGEFEVRVKERAEKKR